MQFDTFEQTSALIKEIEAISIMEPDERSHLWEIAHAQHTGSIVEVGCSHGGTTILLALASGHIVTAVDNGQAGQITTFHGNISKAGLSAQINFIKSDSVEAASLFPDVSCHMVLIDGEHEGDYPYRDLVAWSPKVQSGGYLLMDDTACTFPAVTQATFRFLCEAHEWDYINAFEHPLWKGQVKLLSLRRK